MDRVPRFSLLARAARLSVPLLTLVAQVVAGAPARAALPALPVVTASENVSPVAHVPDPGAVAGRIRGDVMYVTTVLGVRTYDVSDPADPVPLGSLTLPHCCNEDVDTNGTILLVAADHVVGFPNILYVVDVRDPRSPALLASLPFDETRSHTSTCIKRCSFAWVAGSDWISVVDLRKPSQPEEVARFYQDGTDRETEDGGFGTSHDVDVDANGYAWVSSVAGFFGYRTDDPRKPKLVMSLPNEAKRSFENDYIVHNSLRVGATRATQRNLANGRIDPGELLLVTEENWLGTDNGLCSNDGRFQTGWMHRVRGKLVVERLDSLHLGIGGDPASQRPFAATCSAHYFSYRGAVAAVGWYEQGVRFYDLSDPRRMRQIGYYAPVGDVWSTLWHRGYVYAFDNTRGIDVLRFTGRPGDATVGSPPLRSSSGARSARLPGYGLSCRVPVVDTPVRLG